MRLPHAACYAAFALAPLAALAGEPWPQAKDETPYVPTPQNVVDAMLDLAGVRGTDFLMDLGSGDGRIVITAAAKHGARGVGVDYNGSLVLQSRENAEKAGVADRVVFLQQNIQDVDFSPATVLTMYLLPEFNLELRPKILRELRPGARVVSHDYDMGDWPADAKIVVPAPEKTVGIERRSTVYLWVVPAQVMGAWRTTVPLTGGATEVMLDLGQHFQSVSGTATLRGERIAVERAYVQGQFVFFRFPYRDGTVRFEGRIANDRIVGKVTTPHGRAHPWRALRKTP